MSKINYDELIQMENEGASQKELADHFCCSVPAVSKALAKARQNAIRPAILDKLTAKEERFAVEIASGQNQTQAALMAFECSSLDSAKAIGSRLARDPEISEAITAILNSEGLDKRSLCKRLHDHVSSTDAQASLRGVDMSLKLHGAFPAVTTKNLNVNIDISPVDLSRY